VGRCLALSRKGLKKNLKNVTIVLRGGVLPLVVMAPEELDRLLHDLDRGATDPQRYPVQGANAFVWLRLGDVVGVTAKDRPPEPASRAPAAG
jgi:hypothetical protein